MEDIKRPDHFTTPDGAVIEIVYDAEPDLLTLCFRDAVEKAIANQRAKGLPVALFDSEIKMSYLEYPDGHREYRDCIEKN